MAAGRLPVSFMRDALASSVPGDRALSVRWWRRSELSAIEHLDDIIAYQIVIWRQASNVPSNVPHMRSIVRSCVQAGVPVITTQMMESMIMAPSRPRRVSDVVTPCRRTDA
jgi:pyruvate kinase